MIKSKEELTKYINSDNSWEKSNIRKVRLINFYVNYPSKELKKFLIYLRKLEYYINTSNDNKLKKILALYYERKKNKLGIRLGIEIGPNCCGKGLNLYHGGSVINPGVKIGENCTLHGSNCIGNNGITKEVPVIGDNVDIGYGAVIVGGIRIANNVRIGANAVVINSVECENCTVAGIPAKVVKRLEQ